MIAFLVTANVLLMVIAIYMLGVLLSRKYDLDRLESIVEGKRSYWHNEQHLILEQVNRSQSYQMFASVGVPFDYDSYCSWYGWNVLLDRAGAPGIGEILTIVPGRRRCYDPIFLTTPDGKAYQPRGALYDKSVGKWRLMQGSGLDVKTEKERDLLFEVSDRPKVRRGNEETFGELEPDYFGSMLYGVGSECDKWQQFSFSLRHADKSLNVERGFVEHSVQLNDCKKSRAGGSYDSAHKSIEVHDCYLILTTARETVTLGPKAESDGNN